MPKPEFVAIYKLTFSDETEVDAIITAEHIRSEVENLLDEGDSFDREDLVEVGVTNLPALGQVAALRRARNILIATKDRESFEVAQRIDYIAFLLEHSQDPSDVLRTDYNHSRIFSLAERIFHGENPLD